MWIALIVVVPVAGFVAWFIVSALPTRRMTRHLSYDSEGVRISASTKVPWDAIARVEVHTTGAGPWFEDFWIVLTVDGQNTMRIPEPLAPLVLGGLQKLPDFDNKLLMKAVGTATKAKFLCWSRGRQDATADKPGVEPRGPRPAGSPSDVRQTTRWSGR